MLGPLAGEVALVTGGSRSIGAAIAKRLAADGAAAAITYSASPQKAADVVAAIAAEGRALAIKAVAPQIMRSRRAMTFSP
jgi:3-oxoacyl-[acyl-carrier protein] reductase